MRKNRRISKDEYYLQIAKAVAQRAPCLRRQFGAIIVKDDVIVSTGYNGTARGVVNCTEVGCLKDEKNLPHYSGYESCPSVHAEENCVSEDTLIFLSNGEIREAKNVNSEIVSFDRSSFSALPSGATKIESEKPEMLRITTKKGFSIDVSPEHVMLVMDEAELIKEKRAKDLTLNDYLPVITRVKIKGEPQPLPKVEFNRYKLEKKGIELFNELLKKRRISWRKLCSLCKFSVSVISNLKKGKSVMSKNKNKLIKVFPELERYLLGQEIKEVKLLRKTSPEFCQLIGYFIGDGSLSKNYVAFHDIDEDLLRFYNSLIRKVFGIEGIMRKSWKKTHRILIVCSHTLYNLFKSLECGTGKNKRIPELFHRVDEKSLAFLLKGLFDAEGTVSNRAIHLASSSKKLIETIRLLLLRLGIISSLYRIKRNSGFGKHPYFSLEISGMDLIKFYKKIGFTSKKKKEKLKKALENVSENSAVRIYPTEWFKRLYIPSTNFSTLRDRKKKKITYRTAKKIVEESKKRRIPTRGIERLIENVAFFKIERIEKIKKRTKTIDFFVPSFNTFIANGIIVHNCIINAARNGASILGGKMYVYGQNFKDKSIAEARPCQRCKRAIINAGIKEVVTMDEKGKIIKYDVKDWIEEDSKTYINNLKKIKETR
jgi:deoxycytidylate deaminase